MDANLINSKASYLNRKLNCALKRLVPYPEYFSLQEPDYVARLTWRFTPYLTKILKNSFPQYVFNVTGVFCHQSPIVSYSGGRKMPELGDILFVYIEEDDTGRVQYNSLLLQAKMINGEYPKKVSPSEQHQLDLYKKWPKFTYIRPQVLAKGLNPTRDIQPKEINDGAQYLLINPDGAIGCCDCCCCQNEHGCNGIVTEACKNEFFMGCAIPAQTLIADKCLSWELLDFLKFKAGRMFEEDPFHTQDDWTKMIWDLLITSCRTYNRKNIRDINKKRGVFTSSVNFNQTLFAQKLDGVLSEIYPTEDINYQKSDFSDEETCGVSVVVIECRPNKNDRERMD